MSNTAKARNPTSRSRTYPLRLPASLRAAVEKMSRKDGTSINQFIAMAVAEKVSAMVTADEFERRGAKADFEAFDRIMNRETTEPDTEADRLG